MRISHILSLLVLFSFFTACRSVPKGVQPVTAFNKEKYLGTWYEIARFDYKFERGLDNVSATYTQNASGKIRVENRGYNSVTGKWEVAVGKAKPAGDATVGALKVSFFGPFYSGYNVIAIDKDYKYALVAGKSRDYLWFLSREKTMPEEVKSDYLEKAQALGFDTTKLLWIQQTPDSAE